MSPSSREREYAKRRYEKWASKHEQRLAERRRARRNALAAIGAVLGVLLVVGAVVWFSGDDPSGTDVTAQPSAAATPAPTASASPTGSASSSPAAANPCPAPEGKPPGDPKSFDEAPDAALAEGKSWTLALDTTCGPVTITLDGAKAPKAVASTIFLAREGFWNGSPCHRLTTEGFFVLQCGDPTGSGTGGPGYTYGPVENAPEGDLYPAVTVAMARRGGDANSMGSQFFLVYKDSRIPSDAAGGYTVIGRITGGLDTVETVAAGGAAGGGDGAPTRPVSIESAKVTAG